MRLTLTASWVALILIAATACTKTSTPAVSGHHCADLFVKTQVQLAVVPGVWDCLERGVQKMYKGSGDQALAGSSPYFVGEKFIGCDRSVCVYAMSFEATSAGRSGVSSTTMTVWLDSKGLVAHAAIPKPVP